MRRWMLLAVVAGCGVEGAAVPEVDSGAGQAARLAPTPPGTVACGAAADIYENGASKAKCKQVQITNACNDTAELDGWYKKDNGTLVVRNLGLDVGSGATKDFDVDVEPGEGLYLTCGGSAENPGDCCTYTIEASACAAAPVEVEILDPVEF